jgi:hypothetical protein
MAALEEPIRCKLLSAVGRVEACPGPRCAFWDRDVLLGGRCALEELDLSERPDLASLLLRIRGQLESAETREDEDEARQETYRLLATGDADGG